MNELKGIYALWYRELKVFLRERSRVVASIVNPLLWFVIIGSGIGSVVSFNGINYQTFLYPGILIQATLFSSIFYGVYIVWDRKIDFLKEVLVAPISRTSIFIGKVIGGATDTFMQLSVLLLIGFIFNSIGLMKGVNFNLISVFLSIIILFITTISLVSIGLILGSQMESPEGFQLIGSFVIFPMFFLSGALFPIDNLPEWLSPFVFIDPITYSVDALRGILLGISHFPILFDFSVVTIFSVFILLLGIYAFERMKV
ncbi:MAG: ABC transporter permease [Candidatus Altiarchaeota archaeon]